MYRVLAIMSVTLLAHSVPNGHVTPCVWEKVEVDGIKAVARLVVAPLSLFIGLTVFYAINPVINQW